MPKANSASRKRGTAKSVDAGDNTSITLHYDLLDLPTAQHKAGLAGLLMVLDAMKELRLPAIPDVTGVTPTEATVVFTKRTFQAVMDCLYDGVLLEIGVTNRWSGKTPLREEETTEVDPATGKTKTSRRFIYEVVQPAARYFQTNTFGNLSGKKGWLKLWRDTVWGTIRGIPTTRNPYNERAAGLAAKGSGVSGLWDQLVRQQVDRSKNRLRTIPIASSILLGAQDHNAEAVPFQGSPAETLLLHFWVVVIRCFVPEIVNTDGRLDFGKGFIIAVPEVNDLTEFPYDFREILANLPEDQAGYRPADALVSIPQEGALILLSHIASRARDRMQRSEIQYSVSRVEVFHLHKPGNTVATLASDQVAVDDRVLTDFERIHRRTHPLFRAHLIRNLLRGFPWYRDFHRIASQVDASLLVGQSSGKSATATFCRDVRQEFQHVLTNHDLGGVQ